MGSCSNAEISKGSQHELSYRLLSPRSSIGSMQNMLSPSIASSPLAFNWNESHNSSNCGTHLSPRYLSTPNSKNSSKFGGVVAANHTNLQQYPSTDTNMTTCSSSIPDFEHEDSVNCNIDLNSAKCDDVRKCPSIKRIVEALNWYRLHGDDHESVY